MERHTIVEVINLALQRDSEAASTPQSINTIPQTWVPSSAESRLQHYIEALAKEDQQELYALMRLGQFDKWSPARARAVASRENHPGCVLVEKARLSEYLERGLARADAGGLVSA